MYKSNKYYIIEICNMGKSLGFIDYDHSSGGYPTLGPDYMAMQFSDQTRAKENAVRDIKTLATIKGLNINTMMFKILEYGCIRVVSQTSGGFYK